MTVKLAYGPVFRLGDPPRARRTEQVAGRADPGRFDRGGADRLLARTWALYDELAPGVPRERGIGPRMNVRLASATLAFQRARWSRG